MANEIIKQIADYLEAGELKNVKWLKLLQKSNLIYSRRSIPSTRIACSKQIR